jgi:hypothetical protein
MNWKILGRKRSWPNCSTAPRSPGNEWGNPWKHCYNSNWHLPNTSQINISKYYLGLTHCISERVQNFRVTYRLRRQNWKVNQAFCLLLLVSLLGFNFRHWRRRRYFPPKRRAISKLHGVTTQKTVLFIVTAIRTAKSINCSELTE